MGRFIISPGEKINRVSSEKQESPSLPIQIQFQEVQVEIIKEVPVYIEKEVIKVVEVVKEVPTTVVQVIEKIIEIEKPVYVEIERIVEKQVEVVKEVVNYIDRLIIKKVAPPYLWAIVWLESALLLTILINKLI